ncbi:MAG: hypothetical protein Q7T03_10595 [Deltaproteobacteria bacterium]|nr:hypothetical protein [Deltaproteobacteria bacterium]
MNSLSTLIARRYLFSSRQRFVPLLTAVALGGIIVGVWSLMVVLSVMQGFQNELNRRWVGLNAHLHISKLALHGNEYETLRKTISTWPEVADAQAIADGEVIVRKTGEDTEETYVAKIRGVEKIDSNFLSRSRIYPAELPHWENLEAGEEPPLMGGEELLATMGIHPDYSDSVTVIYPFGEIGPTGDWVPHQENFMVTHVFRTGLFEWDSLKILVPLDHAVRLLGDQGETGLQIRLYNLSQLSNVEQKLNAIVPSGANVATFAQENSRLFAALKLERLAMTGFLVLFALIASFSIVGLLLMFIDAKRRDLAILRAIGLSMHGSRQIFMMVGLTLGGVGVFVGGILGWVTCFLLRTFPVPLPSTYYLDSLPVEMNVGWSLGIMLTGLLLTFVSSLYPVQVAGRLDPLPMLREE